MLDGAGRGAGDDGRHRRRTVRRDDDAGRSRALGAPNHRTEVARIRDLVETREQRALRCRELPPVGIAIGLTPGEDGLMVTRAVCLAQLTLELRLHARALDVAQPQLRPLCALRRPELEHLATTAQRLAHGAPP